MAGQCAMWVERLKLGVRQTVDFSLATSRRRRSYISWSNQDAGIFEGCEFSLAAPAAIAAPGRDEPARASARIQRPPSPVCATPATTGGFLILVAALYYLGAKFGLLLTFRPHPVSTLWPTNAILMSMLLLAPGRKWWLILLAAFPAHLAAELYSGAPAPLVFCWFISNSVEALLGATVMRKFMGHPP